MTEQTILLVGGPDSGKTNYVGCLSDALVARKGRVIAPKAPEKIKYVEDTLEHILQGRFAPRTEPGSEEQAEPFSIPVVAADTPDAEPQRIVVPDVTGELWKKAVETSELAPEWMDALKAANGALLFIRIGSDQNLDPPDWVTSAKLLSFHGKRLSTAAKDHSDARADAESGEDVAPDQPPAIIPTQVQLCELLRFLEHAAAQPGAESPKRVAILVTAWDRLDAETAAKGPNAYLAQHYPLFHGRLRRLNRLTAHVFGVSIVGGDFVDADFQKEYLDGDPKAVGYVVHMDATSIKQVQDLTLPIAWVLEGSDSAA